MEQYIELFSVVFYYDYYKLPNKLENEPFESPPAMNSDIEELSSDCSDSENLALPHFPTSPTNNKEIESNEEDKDDEHYFDKKLQYFSPRY